MPTWIDKNKNGASYKHWDPNFYYNNFSKCELLLVKIFFSRSMFWKQVH